MDWLRILESWTTDRLHTADDHPAIHYHAGATTGPIVTLDDGTLATNYSQEEINLLVDPIPPITIRGGYRYEWAMFSRLWPSLDRPRL